MSSVRKVALLFALASPLLAHRLDEYLQSTLLSVEKHHLAARMTLTPGVAVVPFVTGLIDTDGDGFFSEPEQRAYASLVLNSLTLRVDGRSLTPRVTSLRFPVLADMREGRGEIQIEFSADLPPGGRSRLLSIDNRHENPISAYIVNCLVSADPDIRILRQNRNYSQSVYGLEYEETDVSARTPASTRIAGGLLGLLALILVGRAAVIAGFRMV